jgi:uncharacterized membrane protein
MAFCPNCGSQVTGRFCPNCGTDVGAAAAGGSAGTGSTGYVPPSSPATDLAGLTTNVASALCYLFGFITGIIFLVISPYTRNRTVRFHAYQSIFASLAIIVIRIILAISFAVLAAAHAWWLGVVVWRLFDLAVLIGWLYMMWTAYNNRKVKLPVVGDLAEKQA